LDRGSGYNRVKRKLLHITGSLFAFFVGVLPWWVFLIFALVGLGFAYYLKPDHGFLREITKPVDRKLGMISGVRGYFWAATCLALMWPILDDLLHIPHTPRYIAFGWLALTFGDGLAGLVGPKATKLTAVPWNQEKTWLGVLGCAVGTLLGFVFAFGFLQIRHETAALNMTQLLLLGSVCGVLVGLVDSLRAPIDDNYTVGLGAPLIALMVIGLAGLGP
jgi:dolichol kinase